MDSYLGSWRMAGNRTERIRGAVHEQYLYDECNRLFQITDGADTVKNYTYDNLSLIHIDVYKRQTIMCQRRIWNSISQIKLSMVAVSYTHLFYICSASGMTGTDVRAGSCGYLLNQQTLVRFANVTIL